MDAEDSATQHATPEDETEPSADQFESAKSESLDSGKLLIVLVTDSGSKFVLPYESCKTWSDFQKVLKEIYARDAQESRDLIEEQKYDVFTKENEIVLPSVWELLINGELSHDRKLMLAIRFRSQDPAIEERIITIPDPDDDADMEITLPRFRSRSRFYDRDSRSSDPSEQSRILRAEDEESDYESVIEDEERESEVTSDPSHVRIERFNNTPKDTEGKELSFQLRTDRRSPYNEQVTSNATNIQNGRDMQTENLKILKAIPSVSEDQDRMAIQVHTLSGPEIASHADSVTVRWYHLHGNQLDFAQFKKACLDIQGQSARLKSLTLRTLQKIEKENLKVYLDGMFIEPGTVLRGDESNQEIPESVIFSCVPYLDIQPAPKPTSRKTERSHPPRSLMQSYYPYEPVRERDTEQAFRKFKNGSSNKIIYAPSLWIMNIGSNAVVTCGYKPLSEEFVKSITVVQDEIASLNSSAGSGAGLVNIRLMDWAGRVVLYSLDECKTYFEMEQKIRELRSLSHCEGNDVPQITWTHSTRSKRVTPGDWLRIMKTRDLMFIDLSTQFDSNAIEVEKKDDRCTAVKAPITFQRDQGQQSIPPFFHWTQSPPRAFRHKQETNPTEFAEKGMGQQPDSTTSGVLRSLHCLDQVDKVMAYEVIRDFPTNKLDRIFTDTRHYHCLEEKTYEQVNTKLASILQYAARLDKRRPECSLHRAIINGQCFKFSELCTQFLHIVHRTIQLFVMDTDKSTILRKVWGAMASINSILEEVQKRSSESKSDPTDTSQPAWDVPNSTNRSWFVRNDYDSVHPEQSLPFPDDESLNFNIKGCADCRRNHPYSSPDDALQHLAMHLQPESSTQEVVKANITSANLKDWIRTDDQTFIEQSNAGFLAIMSQATENGRDLLEEAAQLGEGVQYEHGHILALYTFPHELLKTLRRFTAFFLAVERALHLTEKLVQKRSFKGVGYEDIPFSEDGLKVLGRFGESVRTSILDARKELCNMVRSKRPGNITERLSLGPQYLCSWFIRRLLVKPLDSSMTAADLYREYLSTIQFQVNHRPGKRLLRSINLLQEELMALKQVNVWQAKLVSNYKRVLDDTTYPIDIPARRGLYYYENLLLLSCLDSLQDVQDDYMEMIRRCVPLSESTKQSAEINEEDHGKAILVFTVVTVIFLPLSFVTSYFGMNTSDIRDMEQKQTLFWAIALPLTTVTMGTILFIAYNGDELRDRLGYIYRRLTGKEDISTDARGISVAQRKRASKFPSDSSSTIDYRSLADDAEFVPPRPAWNDAWGVPPTGQVKRMGEAPNRLEYDIDEEKFQKVNRLARAEVYTEAMPAAMPVSAAPFAQIDDRMRQRTENPFAGDLFRTAPGAGRPAHVRVRKSDISREVLSNKGIPYEQDRTDDDYLIIFRVLSPDQLDDLYEETRRERRFENRRSVKKAKIPAGLGWKPSARDRHGLRRSPYDEKPEGYSFGVKGRRMRERF